MTTSETEAREGDFRALMSTFPSGVAVVTAVDATGRPWGMTCSSLCSVSLSPPMLLVCLRQGSPTLDAVVRGRAFAVNLLHHRARGVAELFASGDPDRFARTPWTLGAGAGGPHLQEAAHAVGDCRVERAERIGDHTVVVGEVERVRVSPSDSTPLLHGLRRFASWPA
jgi:flavin reductase (NADH)